MDTTLITEDQGERRKILLRLAAELACRTAGTRRYLHSSTLEESGLDSQVEEIRKIIHDLMVAVEDRLGDTVAEVDSLPPERFDDGVRAFTDQLQLLSRLFAGVHEFLWYIPLQSIPLEAVALLESNFGDIYRELQRPSVILGSAFNAYEFDLLRLMRTRIPDLEELWIAPRDRVVLQLALCDREAPHAWAILAHEMGHATDDFHGISVAVLHRNQWKVQSNFGQLVLNWCGEFCSDLVAAKALGPAPILALMSAEYSMFRAIPSKDGKQLPVCIPSETHPTTWMRIQVVKEFLSAKGGDQGILEREAQRYFRAWRLSRENHAIRATSDRWQKFFEETMSPLVQEIIAAVDELPLSTYLPDRASLDRCADRLRKSTPISAQGVSRAVLQAKVSEYRERAYATTIDRVAAFKELTQQFTEEPLEYSAILLACFERRAEEFEAIESGRVRFDSGPAVRNATDRFTRLDEIIVQSISSGMIQRKFCRRD